MEQVFKVWLDIQYGEGPYEGTCLSDIELGRTKDPARAEAWVSRALDVLRSAGLFEDEGDELHLPE